MDITGTIGGFGFSVDGSGGDFRYMRSGLPDFVPGERGRVFIGGALMSLMAVIVGDVALVEYASHDGSVVMSKNLDITNAAYLGRSVRKSIASREGVGASELSLEGIALTEALVLLVGGVCGV